MLDIKNIRFALSQILDNGAEAFLKSYSFFESSDIDGIYHYSSLLPTFDKFIFFDFKTKKISLVFSEKNIHLSDFCKHFSLVNSNYSFRDDISRIKLSDFVYITIDGKLDSIQAPTLSTDAKGNIKYADDIEVKAIVVELN